MADRDDSAGSVPAIGELDLHLVAEGKHQQLYDCLGAHPRELNGVTGVAFAVWAPNAHRVSVVGDFNEWDGMSHPMSRVGPGVWELFVPDLEVGTLYKYEVTGPDGALVLKTDPLAAAMQLRPDTASVVVASDYEFDDADWCESRSVRDAPMSIYEVHLGAWRHKDGAWLTYHELADQLVDYACDLGFTHLELMPVMEHPLDKSWGYQVGGYYAPTARYGSPDALRHLIDRCHQRNLGVILDWVPAHFPKDAFGLGRFDGTALYEHLDPRRGEHREWGTYVFNYGRAEVKNFLIANALYWMDEFHVDGLRCDAVASMLYRDYGAKDESEWEKNRLGGREDLEAVDFVREFNDAVHGRFPGAVTIAEESTAWPGVTHDSAAGGLGFDLKWNMGWMHDTLDYFAQDPVHRSYHHNLITFGLMYAFSEKFVLPLSHDEVVHLKKSLLSKMPGDRWQQFANLRCLYAHMWAHPGKKLLFMGGEFGQWNEWTEERPLDWGLLEHDDHRGLQRLVRDLNGIYRARPALYEADHEPSGFQWIDCHDHLQSILAYLRVARDGSYVLCVVNCTPIPRHGYRVGAPRGVSHREILNTDAHDYGGSGVGNLGTVKATDVPCHGQPHSLELTLPPLATLWLVPEGP
ncbi:1,4-alpha-glucan branching protein GlgB [Desulfobulbus sp. AH-315-M07]|nr:1,4-alpha-glucan branching protein GlgB [Desulfobulbus sp. AH-315-M07]